MAGKEAIVVIIDVSKTMREPFGEEGQVKLAIAAEATKLLIQQKLLLAKSHEIGLIVLGSEETENDLAEQYGGYENISVLQELDVSTLDSMLLMNTLTPTNASGDILDAIVVAVSMITNRIGKKKFKKRLFIITDGNCSTNSSDQLQDIIDQINLQDIRVNVIAIGFGEEAKHKQTNQQKKTAQVLSQLIEMVQGAIYPSETAMEIYKQFRKRSVYPVTKYKGQLDFGLGYGIDICVYGKTKEEVLPSLKKHSTVIPFSRNADEGKLKMSREAALEDDPTGTVIDPEDIIKAYFYGKSVVPIGQVDEDLLKFACPKCMKLLGFLPSDAVPRHFFMSGVDMVLPAPEQEQEVVFAAIVQALYQRQDSILARYVSRDNTQPHLCILSPCIKPDLICLWLNYLPTEEDFRDYSFADLVESTPEQDAAAENFINALSLDNDGEALKPSSTFNPTLQYFYQCITFRAENPDQPLPPLDPNIAHYLSPDQELYNNAKAECDRFASMFALREIEVPKKEKKFYADIIKDEGKPRDDIPMAEPFSDQISEINPVDDFYRLLKDRQVDRVGPAIKQMQELIVRLVEKAFQGNTFAKAINCLKNLRQGCLDEDEFEAFNLFMMQQIKRLQQIHPDFWNLVVAHHISLITDKENDKSTVSQAESDAFLVKVEPPQSQSQPADELMDEIE